MISLFFFMIFSFSLYRWASESVAVENPQLYLIFVLATIICAIFCTIFLKRKTYSRIMSMLALVLINVGGAIAATICFKEYIKDGKLIIIKTLPAYVEDFGLMLVAFLVAYYVITKKVYKNKYVIYGMALLSIAILFIATLFEETNGAHISVYGIMPSAVVIMCAPFVIGHFCSLPEEIHLLKNPSSLSLNVTITLIYALLIYVGCYFTNEYSLVMIIGVVSTIVLFIKCAKMSTKIIYSTTAFVAMLVVIVTSGHIRYRLGIWWALNESKLEEGTEWFSYLFRNIKNAAFYGRGMATTQVRHNYETLNTDNVMALIIIEFGIIFSLLLLITTVWLIRTILYSADGLYEQEKMIVISIGLISGVMFLLHMASNLSAFITTGVPYMLVSSATSINSALAALCGTVCAISGNRNREVIQ